MTTGYRYPFTPYPRGWFFVALSSAVPVGGVLPIRYFGKDLVVYRTTSGAVHVADAYCPHLGAHMGHGGRVIGENLRCPFHGHCFDTSGRCVEIPYSSWGDKTKVMKIPVNERVRQWRTSESAGCIFVYHATDDDNETQAPLDFDRWLDDTFSREHWLPTWTIRAHAQDLIENIVDPRHFLQFHSLRWDARTCEREESADPDVFRVMMSGDLVDLGSPASFLFESFGLAVVRTTAVFGGTGESRELAFYTPIDVEHTALNLVLSVKKMPDDEMTEMLLKTAADSITTAVNEDISIWERKIYLDRPTVCEGDGPIMAYRKWARRYLTGPWP